jgi:hypothetical protein
MQVGISWMRGSPAHQTFRATRLRARGKRSSIVSRLDLFTLGPEVKRSGEYRPGENASGPSDAVAGEQPLSHNLRKQRQIRPQPDRENAFARASGGGDGTGGEPSLPRKLLICFGRPPTSNLVPAESRTGSAAVRFQRRAHFPERAMRQPVRFAQSGHQEVPMYVLRRAVRSEGSSRSPPSSHAARW